MIETKIEAILFDCDGVVIDSEKLWSRATVKFLEKWSLEYSREYLKPKLTGKSMIDGILIMQEYYQGKMPGDPKELAKERIEIANQMFMEEISFIPGFEKFYNQVKDKYKTCISTAMDNKAFKIVDGKLGLSSLFNGEIYTIADVEGRSKPDPAIFLHSAKMLGIKPENCIVIEDAPHGITAANKAGMYSIGITTTYKAELLKDADLIVESFDEIILE